MSLPVIPNATINKIISSWKSLQVKNTLFYGDGYVSPTFYLLKGANIPGLNYYDTKEKAIQQLYYLTNTPNSKVQAAKGSISFKRDGTAQTAGINIDIFLPAPFIINYPVPYSLYKEILKQANYPYYILRFYKTNGSGPYFAIMDTRVFGMSATVVKATGDKLAAMNEFFGNLDVIKANYNKLVTTLSELIEKPFDPATSKSIDRLTQQRITMLDRIREIKGIQILSSDSGKLSGIGFPPLVIIAVLAIAGYSVWKLSDWLTEKEKTKRIISSFEAEKLIADEQAKVLADLKAGLISEDVAKSALKNLGVAMETAKVVATKASDPGKSMFGEIGDMVKWAAIGFGVYAIANAIGKNKK